jgi:glutathione S-transferase
MKLFHCPPTRSQRALWALYEAGADFEAEHVNLFTGEQNEPEYRAIELG